MLSNAVTILAAIAGSILGAWVTARLAIRRFKSEALWKRQIEAYDRILSALYEIMEGLKYELNSDPRNLDVRRKLEEQFDRANHEINRLMTVEAYLLSEEAATVVNEYRVTVMVPDRSQDWYQWYEQQVKALFVCSQKVLDIARKDVGMPAWKFNSASKAGCVKNWVLRRLRWNSAGTAHK